MSHDCRQSLCTSPHYANDDHSQECLCEMCHDHGDWQEWTVYPECDGCLQQMSQWIHENTDFSGCAEPELCGYYKWCGHPELTPQHREVA